MKKVILAVAVIALIGAAFWGGTLFAGASSSTPTGFAAGTRGMGAAGGPLADLTEEERTAFQNMTDEERQAFLEEKGIDTSAMPTDGGMRTARGGILEGEVIEVADDTITIALSGGGSQTLYTDENTVVAYAEGVTEMAAGSQVLLFAEPETDGVTTAQAIIVQ
ncbi:MAG: hypothetical protein Q7J82_10005 [Coriobacteriia bacterium]|nr:hypothetical protein [Coriobacteriia bacterium]